jgi:hypothetical protein
MARLTKEREKPTQIKGRIMIGFVQALTIHHPPFIAACQIQRASHLDSDGLIASGTRVWPTNQGWDFSGASTSQSAGSARIQLGHLRHLVSRTLRTNGTFRISPLTIV